MRVTLVQPPSARYDTKELAPPLGLLSLAAILERELVDVSIIDLNLVGMACPDWIDDAFYERATGAIAATEPDVVGLTSMALESHVCLELARRVKAEDRAVHTVLGGPHFSSVAKPILSLYRWIDFVIVGEGETAMRLLTRHLRRSVGNPEIPNVAFRDGEQVFLQRAYKPLGSLGALPLPAYHLLDLEPYFAVNPRAVLGYEHARGCNLRCGFCYSPVHWGQGEQAKSAQRVVEELAELHALGARHVFFVSDNFLNSKAEARRLVRAMTEARLDITWNCYATLAQLTPELVREMGESGCNEVFVGVDAVTAQAQSAFRKTYFRGWDRLSPTLQRCLDAGVTPTCAFMVDPPIAGKRRTDECLDVALRATHLGCPARLNNLAYYGGTDADRHSSRFEPTYTELQPQLYFDTHPVNWANPFAREHPELFPLHHTRMPPDAYEAYLSGLCAAFTLFHAMSRTMLRYRVDTGGSLWSLLEEVAQEVGDLRALTPLERRFAHVEAIETVLGRAEVPPSVRTAHEIDRATIELACGPIHLPHVFGPDESGTGLKLSNFRVLKLARAFDRYADPAAFDAEPTVPTTEILVNRFDGVERLPVSRDCEALIHRLERAVFADEDIDIASDELDLLLRIGLLKEVHLDTRHCDARS